MDWCGRDRVPVYQQWNVLFSCSDPLICGPGCWEISVLGSLLVGGGFRAWHLIGWRHNHQPVGGPVAESRLACMDFDMEFLSNLGPWCRFRHILKHLCYVYQLQLLSLCYHFVIMATWVGERGDVVPLHKHWNFVSLALTNWSPLIWCFVVLLWQQGKSEGFDSCDRPSNLKFDSNRQFFRPCDHQIWWMTLQNNRAPVLCYLKLCASFRSHWWIQIWVTVRKCPIWVKLDDF